MHLKKRINATLIAASLFVCSTSITLAATVWTDWTSFSIGDPGQASGSLGSTTVNYSGEVLSTTTVNGASSIWNPDTTYIGGAVDTSPKAVGDVIGLNGSTITSTISFSSPVINPVIAIWSLGQPSFNASFNFNETPSLQVGGPNSFYGGSSLFVIDNTVSGNEGNGVVLFEGAFSSISWTSTNENWYGFTVGVQAVPVPGAIWLFGSGLIALIGFKKRNT